MEQILLACVLPNAIVIVVMMLYKNTKAMVRSPDGDTDFFDMVYNLHRLRTTNVNRLNERKHTKTERIRQYPAETITDAVYTDDLVLLANRPTQAKPLLQQEKLAAR